MLGISNAVADAIQADDLGRPALDAIGAAAQIWRTGYASGRDPAGGLRDLLERHDGLDFNGRDSTARSNTGAVPVGFVEANERLGGQQAEARVHVDTGDQLYARRPDGRACGCSGGVTDVIANVSPLRSDANERCCMTPSRMSKDWLL